MPDNKDHEDLAGLLADPEGWSANDAKRARMLLRQQRRALAAFHVKDEQRQQGMAQVAAQIEAAIARYESG